MQRKLEQTLAKLYSGDYPFDLFQKNPRDFLLQQGIPETYIEEFLKGDLVGLRLASESFAKKRSRKRIVKSLRSLFTSLNFRKAYK